ncbi:hypothetical protein D9M69_625070 [compost metagenome]
MSGEHRYSRGSRRAETKLLYEPCEDKGGRSCDNNPKPWVKIPSRWRRIYLLRLLTNCHQPSLQVGDRTAQLSDLFLRGKNGFCQRWIFSGTVLLKFVQVFPQMRWALKPPGFDICHCAFSPSDATRS